MPLCEITPAQAEPPARLASLPLDKEISFPQGKLSEVTVGQALAAMHDQLGLRLLVRVDAQTEARALGLTDARLGTVLDALAGATGCSSALRPSGLLVFRSPAPEEAAVRLLRKSGKLKPLEETRSALGFLDTLAPEQQALLAGQGFLPLSSLSRAAREQLFALPFAAARPSVKGTPLARLPEKDLFLVAGLYLRVQVTWPPQTSHQFFLFNGQAALQLDALLALRGELPEPEGPQFPVRAARRDGPEPDDSLATLNIPNRPVTFPPRQPPICALSELIRTVADQTGRELYVDRRLASARLWFTPPPEGIPASVILAEIAEAAGFRWRTVGEVGILVQDRHGSSPGPATLAQVLHLEEKRTCTRALHGSWLWSAPRPDALLARNLPSLESLLRLESPQPWSSVPPDWQRALRKGLRAKAEQTGDERLARLLWLPEGTDPATVQFAPGLIAGLAALPSAHPPGYFWGVTAELTSPNSKAP
jgi:hypothetical protein